MSHDLADTPAELSAVSQQAIAWFATLLDKTATEADRAAFQGWLDADASHRTAYAEIERLWASTETLPNLSASGVSAHKVSRRAFNRFALAAGTAALIIGMGWMLLPDHPFADYRTATGERRNVTLPDGSIAELSTATALSVAFDGINRRVTIHAGEAFFTVAKDTARPFIVEAAHGETTALSTAFSVAHGADGIRIIVTEHTVRVKTGGLSVRLEAGQQVSYRSDRLGAVKSVNPETALAWRESHLVFLSMPLAKVIETLDQWVPGRIVIMDQSLAGRPVTAIINLRQPETMLQALGSALPIRIMTLSPYLTFIFPAKSAA